MKYSVLPIILTVISCQTSLNHEEKKAENGYDPTSNSGEVQILKTPAPTGWIEGDSINLDYLEIQKPVLVYFWTTWCKGCKQAEKWYFEEPENKNHLSENFHLVKINGDSSKIVLNEIQYSPSTEIANRHQLSLTFSKTWFGYPNILLFDKNLNFQNAYEPQFFMGKSPDNFIVKLDSLSSI